LGEFVLDGLRKAVKGHVEVDVTFAIDADGIVKVKAKDKETGQEQSIRVMASSGLTSDEIDQMGKDAQDYMSSQRESEEFEAVHQEAHKLITEIERMFPVAEKLVASTGVGREAMAKARATLDKAQAALSGRELDVIREQIQALTRTQKMFKGVVSKAHG
jgi:molecular chaperone DnaK